jgi:hypothetical protein
MLRLLKDTIASLKFNIRQFEFTYKIKIGFESFVTALNYCYKRDAVEIFVLTLKNRKYRVNFFISQQSFFAYNKYSIMMRYLLQNKANFEINKLFGLRHEF